jgi:homoserine kinase
VYKVQVNVPAALTNLGPGLRTVGLALNLHMHIEMYIRQDGELDIKVEGEDAEAIPDDFQNPVLRAATRLFQKKEMAPAGLSITIKNRIPFNVGLDAEAAMLIGGLVAANNLTGGDYERDDLIDVAMELGLEKVKALTTMLGGLNIVVGDSESLHKSLEPPPLKMVVFVPEVPDFASKTTNALPEHVSLDDAVFNMGRLVFMMDALMDGDFDLLATTMQDRLYQARFTEHIPGFDAAIIAAQENGAAAVTMASMGPTLLAFAPYNHNLIGEAMQAAFNEAGVQNCRFWTLGIDAQGVTVSVAS